jgi:hypothetical protein
MAKLRKSWGFMRCGACNCFTRAKFLHCEHCKVKHRHPK